MLLSFVAMIVQINFASKVTSDVASERDSYFEGEAGSSYDGLIAKTTA